MGLTFDSTDLESTFGLVVDGASTWPKPARDVEMVHVPGRNGDLLFDNGCWQNVEISYNFLIKDNWKSEFENFAAWLCSHVGYFRLEDEERHPGVYRMASFSGPLDPELWFTTDTGVFTIVFNCKPQQWLLSGETPIAFQSGPLFPGTVVGTTPGDTPGIYYEYEIQTLPSDNTTDRCSPVIEAEIPAGSSGDLFQLVITNNSQLSKTYHISYGARIGPYSIIYHEDHVIDTVAPSETAGMGFSASTPSATIVKYFFYVHCDDGLIGDTIRLKIPPIGTDTTFIEEIPTIENPTLYEAKPTVQITNPSGASFTLNGHVVSVKSTPYDNMTIDCETEDCYADVSGEYVNGNSYVSIEKIDPKELRDFPYLAPGENTYYLYSDPEIPISDYKSWDVSITPNWYRI